MTDTYTPREGSIAERVLRYCAEHGRTSTTTLCDEVEDVNRSNLTGCMSTAVRLGAAFVRKLEGEIWYDVKPFVPEDLDGDEGISEILGDGAVVAQPRATVASAWPAAAPPAPPAPPAPNGNGHDQGAEKTGEAILGTLGEVELPILKATHAHSMFAVALFSDGRLVLEFDGIPLIVLDEPQTKHLVHFLDRLGTTEPVTP